MRILALDIFFEKVAKIERFFDDIFHSFNANI